MRSWPEKGRLWTLSLAAMAEAAAVTPWMLLIRTWAGPAGLGTPVLPQALGAGAAAAAWLLVAFFLAGALWERLGTSLSAGGRGWSVLGVLLVLGTAAVFFPWWSLPAAAYLWYQGARQAAGGGYVEVGSHLGWLALLQAIAVLILYAAEAARAAALEGTLLGLVLLLYGSGLGLVARARDAAVRPEAEGQAAGGSGLLTLVMLLAVALAGVLGAHLLSPGGALGGQVVGAFGPLWDGFAAVLGYLAYPFALLLEYVLVPFFRRIAAGEQWTEFLGEPPAEPDLPALPSGEPLLTPELLAHLGAVLLAAGTLAAAAFAVLRLRPNRRSPEAVLEEERISLGFWRSLWQDLQELRLNRTKVGAGGSKGPGSHEGEPVAPGSPRWLYRQLQEWGWAVGRPRRPGETPAAYAEALQAHRPDAAAAVRQVTAVYMEARYSPAAPAGEAVAEAQRALNLIAEQERTGR